MNTLKRIDERYIHQYNLKDEIIELDLKTKEEHIDMIYEELSHDLRLRRTEYFKKLASTIHINKSKIDERRA